MDQEVKVPTWLNVSFLVKVLSTKQSVAEESVQITKFKVGSASKKGDNFASQIFRVELSYSIDGQEAVEQRVIVKARHDNEEMHEIFSAYEIYTKEINFYQNILPGITKLLESIGISVKLAPELIYCDLEKEVLVVEDASAEDYRIAKRENRFCLRAAKITLKKLAFYHAASVIYNEQNNQKLTEIRATLFAEGRDGIMAMINNNVSAFVAEVSSWEGFEEYLPKLKYIQENFKKLAYQIYLPIENGFNCLAHSDLWLCNLLVKYEDDQDSSPLDVLLIDYQGLSWTSPTIDLHHFIYTTLNEDDYQNRLDEIIEYYHKILVDTLTKFGHKDILSLEQLKVDFNKKSLLGKMKIISHLNTFG